MWEDIDSLHSGSHVVGGQSSTPQTREYGKLARRIEQVFPRSRSAADGPGLG
jgi:hypothetical protein